MWGSSNGDGTVVLGVHVVRERFRLESSVLVSPSTRLTLQWANTLERNLPAPQKVEGGVDLFKMSSGSLVFDQRDSDHLGERSRLVVVKILVSGETDGSLAYNQETALNVMF